MAREQQVQTLACGAEATSFPMDTVPLHPQVSPLVRLAGLAWGEGTARPSTPPHLPAPLGS